MDNDVLKEELIGKWEFIKFAYCDNNKKIMNETLIPDEEKSINICNYQVDMSLFGNENLELDTTFLIVSWIREHFKYYIDSNSMKFVDFLPSWIWVEYTETQKDILYVLTNTQRYVIKGNELRIFFTEEKGKNLLILKKIEQ